MPTWYQRIAWLALRELYTPSLVAKYGVSASGVECIPEPPFIMVADHSNELDPWIIGSFSSVPIRFMANLEGASPVKAALSGLVGAYGRRKGAMDIGALRATIGLARAGDSVGIFPEGDRSWDGCSVVPRPGIGKLARLLRLPMVIARQKGNYLSKPRWASQPRYGTWSVKFLRYDADEIDRMSADLIDAIVAAALRKDEIKDALLEGRQFEGEGLALGIGRLLWRCPICLKTDCISGRGDEVFCVRCATRWTLDANCRVEPRNISLAMHATQIVDLKDWHDWQLSTLADLASPTTGGMPGLCTEGVTLFRRAGDAPARRIGRGRIFARGGLRGAELVFESADARRTFDVSRVRGFVDNFNEFCEFDYEGERWRVRFNGANAAKWVYALAPGSGVFHTTGNESHAAGYRARLSTGIPA